MADENVVVNTPQDLFKPDPAQEPEPVQEPEPIEPVEPVEGAEPLSEPEPAEPELTEDEYIPPEEWAAMSPEDQQAVIKAVEESEAAEAHESPAVQKVLKELNSERARVLKEESEREKRYQQREQELNDKHRTRMSDLAGAARVAGVGEQFDGLKKEGEEPQSGAGAYFKGTYKGRQFYDPANPPIVNKRTGQRMSPQQVNDVNQRMNDFIGTIVETVGSSIMEHPNMKGIAPIVQQNQVKERVRQDFEAWKETIGTVFKDHGLEVEVKDESGRPSYSPEYRELVNKLQDFTLFENGARKSPEERLRLASQVLEMTPVSGQTRPRKPGRLPPKGTTQSPRRRIRRPPPDTLVGSGQTASRTQGQMVNNELIAFSSVK